MSPDSFSIKSIEQAKEKEKLHKLNHALYAAVLANDKISVSRYIQQGATLHLLDGDDVHPYNDNDNGILHVAVSQNNVEMVKYLLSIKGLKVDARNRKKETPFHAAVYKGNLEIMSLLLEAGADLEAKEDYEDTAVCWSSYMGHLEVLKFLVEKGAKLDIINRSNYTPLHWACYKGHTEVAKYLIDMGADIHAKNDDGDTPLMSAIENGHTDTVLFLVEVEKKKAVEKADAKRKQK